MSESKKSELPEVVRIEVPLLQVGIQIHPPKVISWLTMSSPLMQSATLFARRALAIEEAHAVEATSHSEKTWHRSCVLSGIVSACSSVEAFINELFIRVIEADADPKPFDDAAQSFLRARWSDLEKQNSALEKVQLALFMGKAQALSEGAEPFQSSALAFTLRNEIVHYKARVYSSKPTKLEKQLANRFTLNPIDPPGVALFPYGCISHGCLEWVIKSHLALLAEFTERLEIDGLTNSGWNLSTR